jgi:cytochrome c1
LEDENEKLKLDKMAFSNYNSKDLVKKEEIQVLGIRDRASFDFINSQQPMIDHQKRKRVHTREPLTEIGTGNLSNTNMNDKKFQRYQTTGSVDIQIDQCASGRKNHNATLSSRNNTTKFGKKTSPGLSKNNHENVYAAD